jgi:NAD(P)-dependent dehydrogenase (short-subunit alcohol dehydrogenase family)
MAWHFLERQLRPLPVPSTSYAGHTIIVTGANGGLGLEAARHFVRLGAARVILACRSTERGEAAKANIEQSLAGTTTTTTTPTVVEVWPLDLCSFDSVRAFCRRADAELDRLDVFLANAAMLSIDGDKMAEGYEMQVTTNVISTFLMVFMLLPLMRRTATRWNVEGAVTLVASEAHIWVG